MIYNIQVLRALAALLVVFAHMDRLLAPLTNGALNLSFATSGVDLFFVISGFVMVHTCVRRPLSPVDFALNRIVRIVPLYWLLTLAVFAVAMVAPSLVGATRASLPDLMQSLLFIPFQKGDGLVQPVLFLGWTLNYEMFFYLLFAVALWICGGRMGRVVLAVTSALALLALAGWWLRPAAAPAAFYTNSLMLEFALGMTVGLLHRRALAIPPFMGAALVTLGLAALFAASLLTDLTLPVVQRGLPATMIVVGALALEGSGTALRTRSLQLLGAASYAMYLIHPFLLRPIEKLAAPFLSGWLAVPVALLAMGVVIGASIALHSFVELPITNRLRRRIGHAPSTIDQAELAMAGDASARSNDK